MESSFRSGFVTLLGMPNVGKSTLMNALVGVPVSVATPKAHTTREKILGIMSSTSFQLVFCDTPGLLRPSHALQQHMQRQLRQALEGLDVALFLLSAQEKPTPLHRHYFDLVDKEQLLLLLNKADCCSAVKLKAELARWEAFFDGHRLLPISALKGEGLDILLSELLDRVPVHPPYYPLEQLSDKTERFMAAELLRKHILLGYKAEVPYSTYVSVFFFRKIRQTLHIHAQIYVERPSQKAILIGKAGRALRGVGQRARGEMQRFFGQKVYLRTRVHVIKDWKRKNKEVQRMPHQ